MSSDMLLIIDGIKGESEDKDYKGAIEVLSWGFGASNQGSFHHGGGGGVGKADVHDMSITKYVDCATAALQAACLNGKHLKSAKLVVRKGGGDKALAYQTWELEEVMVSSFTLGGSNGEGLMSESLTLHFGKFKFAYKTQDGKGGGKDGGQYGWDIGKGAKV